MIKKGDMREMENELEDNQELHIHPFLQMKTSGAFSVCQIQQPIAEYPCMYYIDYWQESVELAESESPGSTVGLLGTPPITI